MTKVDDPRNIQAAYDDLGNPAQEYRADSYGTMTPGERAKLDQIDAGERDRSANEVVRDGEQPSNAWIDNTKPNDGIKKGTDGIPMSRGAVIKLLVKRGGPVGLVIALLVFAAGFFGGPATLFLSLKENLTINWDQQNFTAERRSQRILAKRLGNDGTTGKCGAIKFACRYEKPSTRQLNSLDEAGIKALRKDGSIISKQKIINGERPAYYYFGEVTDEAGIKKIVSSKTALQQKLVPASGFLKELRSNADFRSAFRRAYNPRWVNFVDSKALSFLQSLGISKSVNKAVSEAVDADAAQKAIQEIADGKSSALGDDAEKAVKEMVEKESKSFAASTAKQISKADDSLMWAVALCAGTKVPGVYTTVFRNYRTAQMGAAVFSSVLTPTDAIKANKGTPKMAENIGNLLTKKDVNGKTAMDSGAIKYGMLGDRAAARQSTTLKKYIPGYTGNSLLNYAASFGNNGAVKNTCSALTSGEAQIAALSIDAVRASNPAGWLSLALGVGVELLSRTGALDAILTQMISGAMSAINGMVDWKSVLGMMAGDFMKDAEGEQFGDMVGVTAAVLGNLANQAGNIPLTASQKAAFDNDVATPTKLAWAEEDRLTHSPFDASNPNTFMGSIFSKFVGTYGIAPSITNILSGSLSLMGAFPRAFFAPAHATSSTAEDWRNQCPSDGDYAIANADVAAGPLCDVQYAVPAKYINLDPVEVATSLYTSHQIDAEGEVVSNSDLANYIAQCNTSNTYSLDECKINDSDSKEAKVTTSLYTSHQIDAEGEVVSNSDLANYIAQCNTSNTYSLDECKINDSDSKEAKQRKAYFAAYNDSKEDEKKAYYALYQIDKRTIDGMDNDPPTPGGGDGGDGSGDGSGTTEDTGPCFTPGTINMGIYDNAHDAGKKTSVRICAVTNLSAPGYKGSPYYSSIKAENPAEQSQAEGKALVNARASAAAYKMVDDAKKDGVDLNLGGYFAFRTYEHQVALRKQWCAKGNCDGAAEPGTSNHEMGLAIDFNLPGTNKSAVRNASKELQWLRANAGKYSFKETVSSEDWHWAYRP